MELMVEVHYVTEGVPGLLKGMVQKEHMRCYGIFADASYDLYKEWNAEYDRTFGEVNGPDDMRYNSWVAKKAEAWVQRHVYSPIMTFTVRPEDNVLIGHLKKFPDSNIYFYMTEV